MLWIAIIISVAIACGTIWATVRQANEATNKTIESVNRHTTEVFERIEERSEKRFEDWFTRFERELITATNRTIEWANRFHMEVIERMDERSEKRSRQWLTAWIYALNKASMENRQVTGEDLVEGMKFARDFENKNA